jgi:hypothetical protein
MAIAMVSEQREVNKILKQLLSNRGNEMYVLFICYQESLVNPHSLDRYLVPMTSYMKKKCEVSFYDIMAITNMKGHLTIGYKVHENACTILLLYYIIVLY